MVTDLSKLVANTAKQLKTTEADIISRIESVVNILAPMFAFGYFATDDMKQEGLIEGMKCLKKYDKKRRLENLLFTHIRNRFINLKRNKFSRNDPPCLECHLGNFGPCGGVVCGKYKIWAKTNFSKKSLMSPVSISSFVETSNSKIDEVSDNAEADELFDIVESRLPNTFLQDYLKLKDGQILSKNRMKQIQDLVKEILRELEDVE